LSGDRWSPHGRLLAVTRSGSLQIWNSENPVPILDISPWQPDRPEGLAMDNTRSQLRVSVAFSPDSSQVVTTVDGPGSGVVQVWDVATGKELTRLEGHEGPVWDVSFHPDGEQIATASPDKTARLWSARTGQMLALCQHAGEVCNVWFSPDGQRFVTCSGEMTAQEWTRAQMWDARDGRLLWNLQVHTDNLKSVVFSADAQKLITASRDSTVRLWNAESGQLLATAELPDWAFEARFDSDERRIIITGESKLWIWRPGAADPVEVLPGRRAEFGLFHIDLSPSGHRAVWRKLGAMEFRLLDTETGQVIVILEAPSGPVPSKGPGPHDNEVFGSAFSPDESRLAIQSYDNTVRIYQLLGRVPAPPKWFGDFLFWVAQRSFNDYGEIEVLSARRFLALRKMLERTLKREDSRYADIARRFLEAAGFGVRVV